MWLLILANGRLRVGDLSRIGTVFHADLDHGAPKLQVSAYRSTLCLAERVSMSGDRGGSGG
ncbi:hypothetical protein [Streptomyces sp. CMB-StM0423]|uniref:hypothetical protein n=1 Tax=Streptomyces sp. CMB-StM0423 TaxID=2059884 RepID=UPI00131CC378|nr:hypothetical protein [Streptomyces sp. CMB-StM0423]